MIIIYLVRDDASTIFLCLRSTLCGDGSNSFGFTQVNL